MFSTHQMEAAEALCESLAIVDDGRLVAAGTLGELKRGSRARTLRLGVAGETMPSWLAAVPGVVAVRPGAGFAEVELDGTTEPDVVLAAALERGAQVTRFDLAEPSLETIFIELVGRPADAPTDGLAAPPTQPAEPAAIGTQAPTTTAASHGDAEADADADTEIVQGAA